MERERLSTTINSDVKKAIQIESVEQGLKNNELIEITFMDYYKKSKSERKSIVEKGKSNLDK